MDFYVTRGGYDKAHHIWTDQGDQVIVLHKAGGPYSNVALHYLCRAFASSAGEEDDGHKIDGHREEFGSIL